MSAAQKTNDPSTAADSTKARSALWSIPATLGALSNTVCIGVAIRSSQLGVSTFAASDSLSPSPPLGVDFTSSREEFFVFLQQTTATINAASAANAMPTKTHVCSRDRVVSGECAVGTGCAPPRVRRVSDDREPAVTAMSHSEGFVTGVITINNTV